MSIDLDRITHPLRLARGSHQPGSGKGCAMNAISYINGDSKITDYPECSARPLARLVQMLNDHLADDDDFLSPESSILVLDLGWLTVGTADVPRTVVWRWLSELLTDPDHGVVRQATPEGAVAIRRVASLCVREADGERVSPGEWRAASAAADAAAAAKVAATAAAKVAATAAATAAAYAAAAAEAYAAAAANAYANANATAEAYAAADAYVYCAAADADAAAEAYTDARAATTRWAITRWRELAGLDTATDIDTAAVDAALARIHAK